MSRQSVIPALVFSVVMGLPWNALDAQDSSGAQRTRPEPPKDEFNWENYRPTESNLDKYNVVEFHDLAKGKKFDLSGHIKIYTQKNLLTTSLKTTNCSKELVYSVYRQDIMYAFYAPAHFDNCAFDESIYYIEELLKETEGVVKTAEELRRDGDFRNFGITVAEAMAKLGQALHGIQDFYAHTNYVDLMDKRKKTLDKVKLVKVWTPEGRAMVKQLQGTGLISGVAWWEPGNECPAGSLTHGELNKDKDDGSPGIDRWKGRKFKQAHNYHRMAKDLAVRTTDAFLAYAFNKWPILADACRIGIMHLVHTDLRASME